MSDKHTGAEPSGKVVYNGSIVRGIVVLAVSEVGGVAIGTDKNGKCVKDNIKLSFDGRNVCADITVSVRYGCNIPDAAYNIQQSVKHSVEAMSEYKIDKVDVHVVNVLFDDADAKADY